MTEIDIGRLTQKEIRNLSGYDRGLEARQFFNLDQLDQRSEPVLVALPRKLMAINPSFIQGMFALSVKQFGSEENFLRHYKFDATGIQMEQLIRGINRCLVQSDLPELDPREQ